MITAWILLRAVPLMFWVISYPLPLTIQIISTPLIPTIENKYYPFSPLNKNVFQACDLPQPSLEPSSLRAIKYRAHVWHKYIEVVVNDVTNDTSDTTMENENRSIHVKDREYMYTKHPILKNGSRPWNNSYIYIYITKL